MDSPTGRHYQAAGVPKKCTRELLEKDRERGRVRFMERYSEFWGWLVGFLVVYLVGWIGCWRLQSYRREN